MDQASLLLLLKTVGMPVTYHHWNPGSVPQLPYLVYLFAESDNFGADNKVYQKINNYQVELYSEKKDTASEEMLEGVFAANDIYWEKSEVYIKDEELYEVLYLITI